jgi:hypothetical protein
MGDLSTYQPVLVGPLLVEVFVGAHEAAIDTACGVLVKYKSLPLFQGAEEVCTTVNTGTCM